MIFLRWRDPIGRYYLFRGLLSRVYLPILVIFMAARGLSLEQIALIATLGAVTSFVFEVPSGAVADFLGHRLTLVISMIGQAVSALAFIGETFPWILFGTMSYYFFGSLLTGTGEALFFEYLKRQNRQDEHLKLSGEGKSFSRLLNIVSVVVGGATYAIHPALPFLICALQFVAAAWVISTFPAPPQITSVEKSEGLFAFTRHFPTAIKTTWQNPRLFWLTVVNALILGSVFGSADFQQLIFENLGATTLFIGVIYGLKRALGVIITARVHLVAKQFSPPEFMTMLAIILVLHYLLIPVASTPESLATIIFLATTIYSALEVAGNDYFNQIIDSQSRATTLSVSNFARTLVTTLVIASFGVFAHAFSIERIYPIIGLALAALLAVPLVMLRRAYARA